MKTTPNFNKRFKKMSNGYMRLILKTRKLKAIKDFGVKSVEPDLNCYKNFIMNSFALYDVHNLNLKLYYSMLPSAILKNPRLVNQVLLELNADGYIYLRKSFFTYFIVDNQKTWVDLPCGSAPNKDLADLVKLDTSLKRSTEPLLNEEEPDTLFLINDEPDITLTTEFTPPIATTYLTTAQIDALESMEVIVNLLTNVFIRLYLQKEKVTKEQKVTLNELAAYNNWVIKAKQQQFEKESSSGKKKSALTTTIQQAIQTDLQNCLVVEPEGFSHNNYFDEALNKTISKEGIKTFEKLGWKKAKALVIEQHRDLFGFLGIASQKPAKVNKKLVKATKKEQKTEKATKTKEGK